MGRGRRRESPSCRTYGFPVFSVFWVNGNEAQQAAAGGEGGVGEKSTATVEDDSGGMLLALGGGGGEGRSGIPNALLLVCFDPASRSLSEKPVHRLATDQDVPYRMVQHPMGEGLLCSFPKGCRWYEWDAPHGSQDHKLTLKLPEKTLTQFNDVGLQLALAFNLDGSLLATGGEDGHMKIFKWPAMEIVLEHRDGNQSVKDLDFSSNSKFLASVANNGLCRIWDPNSTEIIANLSRENGEKFGHCRFSMTTNDDIVLYTTASEGKFGKVLSWSTTSWNRLKSKIVAKDPISAFSVSNNGKLLAIGTSEGDVIILDSSDMQIHTTVKQAHLGLVTALAFAQDSRTLASSSFDSTVCITVIERQKGSSMKLWVVIVVVLLAILVYYLNANGIL